MAFQDPETALNIDSEASAGLTHQDATVRTCTLSTPTSRGNCDPFDIYPVKITPEVSRIIAYSRACYKSSTTAFSIADYYCRAFDSSFASPETIPCVISSYAYCLARLLSTASGSELEQTCLTTRGQALKILRKSITQHRKGTPFLSLLQQVSCLYALYIDAEDFEAARIHLPVLCWLADKLPVSLLVGTVLFTALHCTYEVALFTSQPVDLEHINWFTRKFAAIGMTDVWRPELSHCRHNLHRSVESSSVKQAFIHVRELHYMVSLIPPLSVTGNAASELWYSYQIMRRAVLLLNHYLGQKADWSCYMDNQAGHARAAAHNRALEALLSLTLLCSLRQSLSCSMIPDTKNDVCDASQILAHELIRALDIFHHARKFATSSSGGRLEDEIVFWALFTGAWFEHNQTVYARQVQSSNGNATKGWFSKRLVKQICVLSIDDWAAAGVLLERFFLVDVEYSQSSRTWFEKILSQRPLSESEAR